MLYLAARNEHIKNVIYPALKKKKVIISDRFTDSTFAYQVYGKKVKRTFIDTIHKFILKKIRPNITFILTVSPKSSKKRLSKRRTKNRYDNFPQSFYSNAQKAFIKLAKKKKRYFILDSSKNDKNLEKLILKIVCKQLGVK